MEELFDIVDLQGIPTGETVTRSEAHAKGIPHRTAHIWVVREHNGSIEVLLQKRAEHKDSYPGCWDTSSAGHITAGDEPLSSALRELKEELGIAASAEELQFTGIHHVLHEKEFYGKPFIDNETVFMYVYTGIVHTEDLVLQKEEVQAVSWFALSTVRKAAAEEDPHFCVPLQELDLLTAWLEKEKHHGVFHTQ